MALFPTPSPAFPNLAGQAPKWACAVGIKARPRDNAGKVNLMGRNRNEFVPGRVLFAVPDIDHVPVPTVGRYS